MSSVILSGPLATWRDTFVRWAAELRKISFLFLDDLYWSTWDPTYPTLGTMTFTASTGTMRYRILGGSLIINGSIGGTTTGVGVPYIAVTLPVNVKVNQTVAVTNFLAGATLVPGAALTINGNQILVYAGNGGNWPIAGVSFSLGGELELETPQTRKAA